MNIVGSFMYQNCIRNRQCNTNIFEYLNIWIVGTEYSIFEYEYCFCSTNIFEYIFLNTRIYSDIQILFTNIFGFSNISYKYIWIFEYSLLSSAWNKFYIQIYFVIQLIIVMNKLYQGTAWGEHPIGVSRNSFYYNYLHFLMWIYLIFTKEKRKYK